MNLSDQEKKQTQSSTFYPYHHQDFYAMDSLFLSPFKTEEVWDFHAVPSVHLGFFGFLALRACQRKILGLPPLSVMGLSRVWRTYLAKLNRETLPIEFLDFIPSLVENANEDSVLFQGDSLWEKRISLQYQKENKGFLVYIAVGKEHSGESGVSELMQEFLSFSQREHNLEQAFIRKETSSYLYLNGKEENPRVFYRESPMELPPFLLLIANLNRKKLIP